MFKSITIPYECVMLYNTIKLKPGVAFEDAEMAMGEMCNVVKNEYGNDDGGFVAGQVFKYSGFVSKEGTIGTISRESQHIVIITYWKSFDQHETSHANELFKEKFGALADLCTQTTELGYELLWQGEAE